MDLQLRILSNENFRKTNAVETKFFHTEAVLFKRKNKKRKKRKGVSESLLACRKASVTFSAECICQSLAMRCFKRRNVIIAAKILFPAL